LGEYKVQTCSNFETRETNKENWIHKDPFITKYSNQSKEKAKNNTSKCPISQKQKLIIHSIPTKYYPRYISNF
jgi:hypothetical protein